MKGNYETEFEVIATQFHQIMEEFSARARVIDSVKFILPIFFLKFLAHRQYTYSNQIYLDSLVQQEYAEKFDSELKDLFESASDDLGGELNEFYRKLLMTDQGISSLFVDYRSIELGPQQQRNYILRWLLEKISALTIDWTKLELWEYLVHACTRSRDYHFSGSVLIEPHISELLVRLLNPQPSEGIYDPCCETGGSFLSALRFLKEKDIPHVQLYGQDRSPSAVAIAKMGLYLWGLPTYHVKFEKSLKSDFFDDEISIKSFHNIICAPPIGARHISHENEANVWRSKLSSEYIYLDHVLSHLNSKSRAAIIFSGGALSRGGVDLDIRKALIINGQLDAVIALPTRVFRGASRDIHVLILRPINTCRSILFINAASNHNASKSVPKISPSQISDIVSTYSSRKQLDGYSIEVSPEDIFSNNFNLNVARYIRNKLSNPDTNPLDAQKRSEIQDRLNAIDLKLRELMS